MEQQRSIDRDSLLLLAVMRLPDLADQHPIKVRNLSNGGLMGESAIRPACGERLMVELRNIGWVGGIVAWVTDNRFGMVFDREIDGKAVRRSVFGPDHTEAGVARPRLAIADPPLVGPGGLRRV